MIYPIIWTLHIIAACVSTALVVSALYVLWQGMSPSYRAYALVLGLVAAFEVFTGTVLAILSPELSAIYLSTHIAAYIGACFVIEALLFIQMQKVSLAFPLRLAASPVLASLVLFVAAASLGL